MLRRSRGGLYRLLLALALATALLAARAQELTLDEATAQAVAWFNEADSLPSDGAVASVPAAETLQARAMDLLGQVSAASGGKHAAAAFLLGMMRQVPREQGPGFGGEGFRRFIGPSSVSVLAPSLQTQCNDLAVFVPRISNPMQ